MARKDDELLTVTEATDIIGCSEETLRRWARTGRVPAQKKGRDWLFKRSAVEAFKKKGVYNPNMKRH